MLKIMPGNRESGSEALRYQSMNLTSEILVIPTHAKITRQRTLTLTFRPKA